ncbi:aminodeoxychorismate synthase component I [Mesorhizobium sp. L-8-10]|uniref:aminodeoxychorismate synthase component I n=1 Tax=Mesorhizobium sp. L-8-10 TaxID=2744523 RepID=UPI001926EB92|nr:aminodeoxychorismate synthase component I [Mesorhizobium sp. L-8-10]
MSSPSLLMRDDTVGREILFVEPMELIRADDADGVIAALDKLEAARRAGKWTAGYFAYEAGYAFEPKLRAIMPDGRRTPLVLMGVFKAPHERAIPATPASIASLSDLRASWSFEQYLPRFERLHQHLREGDCYQANLSFPVRAIWDGAPAAIFDAMTARQPVRYAALADLGGPVILSRSPELFFEIDADGWIETHPMKGTIRRGMTEEEDVKLIDFLHNDEKNRAENRMIVDLLRNDISRICELGTLDVPELFRIDTYPTVHQMVSRVRAKVAPGTSPGDIFAALFPCGSITGAPKLRAMEILHAIEERPRDAYCGSIGFIAPTGEMRFNVAIRTITLHEDGEAVFNVGGGIVFDSDARSEYEECLLKARFAAGFEPATYRSQGAFLCRPSVGVDQSA